MDAAQKNFLINEAKAAMTTAIGLVIAEVYTGLAQAPAWLVTAAGLIEQAGDVADGQQARARAEEAAGILAIPWPFIYAGSTAWIAAVTKLRDGLPTYVDLQPAAAVDASRAGDVAREREASLARARERWNTLPEVQRTALSAAGLSPEVLRGVA